MENEFHTKDFYIASILLASKKINLLRLDRTTEKLVTFVFDNSGDSIDEIIRNHWSRKNRVISLDLIEAISQLKTRIYTGV